MFAMHMLFIFSGSAAQRGLWPPRSRGFLITHNDAPQSVGLLWTGDQSVFTSSSAIKYLLVDDTPDGNDNCY
jgi:hypothetical protein